MKHFFFFFQLSTSHLYRSNVCSLVFFFIKLLFSAYYIVILFSFMFGVVICYRDIKGANILITVKGIIKLIDFGCAKELVSAVFFLKNNHLIYFISLSFHFFVS